MTTLCGLLLDRSDVPLPPTSNCLTLRPAAAGKLSPLARRARRAAWNGSLRLAARTSSKVLGRALGGGARRIDTRHERSLAAFRFDGVGMAVR